MTEGFRSRKFLLACVSLGAAIAGLFEGSLSEQSFVILVGGVLGLYGYQNIQQGKM